MYPVKISIVMSIIMLMHSEQSFSLGKEERTIYDAYKLAKTARSEERKHLKEVTAQRALLIEKEIVNGLRDNDSKNIGSEEIIALTNDTSSIISEFLNDGLYFKGHEILKTTEKSSKNEKLAERFLHTALDFKLALANHQSKNQGDCEQQYFSTDFDPTKINTSSVLKLENLPIDPRFLRRLSLAAPKDGIAEYYFHNGVGDVVKISFLKNKPTFQIYTMMTYEDQEFVKKIGSDEYVNINGLSLTVGAKHQIAQKTLGKTDLSLSTDTKITTQVNQTNEEKEEEGEFAGPSLPEASAEASLFAEKGNKTLLFTGGIRAVCKKNSDCEEITDYRHIQLGSVRFENPTLSLNGKISTESNVLTADIKRGDYKGSRAIIDQSGDIDLTGKYHAYIFEQEVRYSIHANRKSNGEHRIDVSIEDSYNNKYNFNQNQNITKISMQNTIFKSKETTCTGIYEVFERHTNKEIILEYDRGEITNKGYYEPRYGSDAFDTKGAGVALTIHCKS